MLVVQSLFSVPSVSRFMQRNMNQILGPLLIAVGPSWQAEPVEAANSGVEARTALHVRSPSCAGGNPE